MKNQKSWWPFLRTKVCFVTIEHRSKLPGTTAKFQKILETFLQDLDGVVSFLDDILITEKDKEEHLARLEVVLLRLQNAGLKLALKSLNFWNLH